MASNKRSVSGRTPRSQDGRAGIRRRSKSCTFIALAMTAGLGALLFVHPWSSARAQENPHEELTRECDACHTTASFTEIEFQHGETGYALEGPHGNVPCLACHTVENFSKVDEACESCHADVHRALLGNECSRCHTPFSWTVFDAEEIHMRTNFPMMGRHNLIDCEACHSGLPAGDLALNASRCVDCHRQDYLDAVSPNHVAGAFSTECTDCHFPTRWHPAMMTEHDALYFPIFSGTHRGEWDTCANCHVNPDLYAQFECIVCHEHRQTSMDAVHQGFQGYAYVSAECLRCHPTGEAGEFRQHDPQFFPIFSGPHGNKWESCSTCHFEPSDRALFTCLSCHQHDQPRMDDKHAGQGGYIYESGECLRCHPNGRKEDG